MENETAGEALSPSIAVTKLKTARNRKALKIAFIGWNPAQFLHFAPIAAQFEHVVYLIEDSNKTKYFNFEDLPGKPEKVLVISAKALQSIDGRFKIIVAQSPFAGMETLRQTRLAMLQVGYSKGSMDFAPWRSMADLCMTFGNIADRKLEIFSECKKIGNPRYRDWETPEFKQAALEKYGPRIDPAKKTLLYAPTWGKASSLDMYSDALHELGRDYNIIWHLHPRSEPDVHAAAESIRKLFIFTCNSRDNIAELLAVADLLITDTSGAMFDAIFCRKPIVLLETGLSVSKADRSNLEHERRRDIGRQVFAGRELREAVAEALSCAPMDIKSREGFRNELFANPDSSVKAAKQALLALATDPPQRDESQQVLRSVMRSTFQNQRQLQNARTVRGFLRYHMGTAGVGLGLRFPFLQLGKTKSSPTRETPDAPLKASGPTPHSVGHINFDASPEEIHSLIDVSSANGSPDFLHVSQVPGTGTGMYLLNMARGDLKARACVLTLARAGYFPYKTSGGKTCVVSGRLTKFIGDLATVGKYDISNENLIYTVTPPLEGRKAKRLMVMFSAARMVDPGLKRFFTQDFLTIQKFLAPETAVLRIADVGGIIGAFYLNTIHRPDNAEAVQNLIRSQQEKLGIEDDAVVLYGVSKGATGALYHGLKGGYRFVSVDPIVSTEFYRETGNWHYTESVFPERKEETFNRLFDEVDAGRQPSNVAGRSALICSDRSEQFPYISAAIFDRFETRMTILNSQNPKINHHGVVAARTINSATMLFNMQLYGMDLQPGLRNID